MPSSAIQTVTDLDEYRTAASRRAAVELTVIQRGSFTASITRVDLHRVWMQRGHERLARIRHAEPHPGRNIISFLTQDGQRTVRNGVEFHPGDVALLSPHPRIATDLSAPFFGEECPSRWPIWRRSVPRLPGAI
jgi:hypothetical protein